MNICVQGLWHLGSVTAACMASVGHKVVGLDYDNKTVKNLSTGKAPLFEPGLDKLLQEGLEKSSLCFTDNPQLAHEADVLWIAYDTPVDQDDNADVDFVINATQKTFPYLKQGCLVLISSQLPALSIQRMENYAALHFSDKMLSFACSPENLRLGKALNVFLEPDRIIVGYRRESDRATLEKLLFPITDRVEWMGVESAEMTKHGINGFLALSVTFANELATLCEEVGADAKEVERGLKSESRIGPKAYLAPGGAFAGGTLARDIRFMCGIGDQHNLCLPLIGAVKQSNDAHKLWVRHKLKARFGTLGNCHIAVWGLTYKPGTSTLRRSLAVETIDWLLENGAVVSVHDPEVIALPDRWGGKVRHVAGPLEALNEAAALLLCTEWPEYQKITSDEIFAINPHLIIYDANRFLKPLYADSRITLQAVGMPTN